MEVNDGDHSSSFSFRFLERESNDDNAPQSPTQELASLVISDPQTPPRPSNDYPTWSPHYQSPCLFHHCVYSLPCHKGGAINAIAITKSGQVLTCSDSPRIRVRRKLDYIERGCIKAGSGEVRAMISHGNTAFTSHRDRKIRIWNVGDYADGKFSPKKVATLPKSSPTSLLFFSRGNLVQQHKDTISCMAYCSKEDILYTGSWDFTIKAWRVRDQKCADTFRAHSDKITSLVVNQHDGCLFSGSLDSAVKIWRRGYGGCPHNLIMALRLECCSPVNALALSHASPSDHGFLYSGSSDGYANFWVKDKSSCRYSHGGSLEPGHGLAVLCLAVVGKMVITGSEDGTVRIWRRGELGRNNVFHECVMVLEGHKGPVKCVNACLELDGAYSKALFVYSASLDQTFKIWRVKFLEELDDAYFHASSCTNNDEGYYDRDFKYPASEMSPVLSPLWVDRKRLLDGHGSH